MLQMNEDKRPKKQGNLLSNKIHQKIGHEHEKDGNTYKIGIQFLFLIAILLFSIIINISIKSKGSNTKDILSSFVYYNIKREGLNSEINFVRTNISKK